MVIEVNPRFSLSTSPSHTLRFYEAEICVKHFLFNEDDLIMEIKKRLRSERYIEDFIVNIS